MFNLTKKPKAEWVILQRTARSRGVAKEVQVKSKLTTPREPANLFIALKPRRLFSRIFYLDRR